MLLVSMRRFLRAKVGRLFAIFVSTCMTYGSASAGINSAIMAAMQASRQVAISSAFAVESKRPQQSQQGTTVSQASPLYADCPPGYTQASGPVYLGVNPSRDPIHRG